MSEIKEETEIVKAKAVKIKNQKRVEAGKKGAEAKKIKAALKRKERENIQLKSITNNENNENKERAPEVLYKNYIPLCVVIGIVGLGLYTINRSSTAEANRSSTAETRPKQVPVTQQQPTTQKKEEIDPFEFN